MEIFVNLLSENGMFYIYKFKNLVFKYSFGFEGFIVSDKIK